MAIFGVTVALIAVQFTHEAAANANVHTLPSPSPSSLCVQPLYSPYLPLSTYPPARFWCSDCYWPEKTVFHTVYYSTVTVPAPTKTVTETTTTAITTVVESFDLTTPATTTTVTKTDSASTTQSSAIATNTVAVATNTVTVTSTSFFTTTTVSAPGITIIPPRDIRGRAAAQAKHSCPPDNKLCSLYNQLTMASPNLEAVVCSCLGILPGTKTLNVFRTSTVTNGTAVLVTIIPTQTISQTSIAGTVANISDTITASKTVDTTLTLTSFFTLQDNTTLTTTVTSTVNATATVTGCFPATSTPAALTCGKNYIYIGESNAKIIEKGQAASVENCAAQCTTTQTCVTIAYSAPIVIGGLGVCNLFSASVASLKSGNLIAVPTVAGQTAQVFYDIACFTCPAAATVTTAPPLAVSSTATEDSHVTQRLINS